MNERQLNKITAEVQRLKHHLQKHPEQALELAISHYQDYLVLVTESEKLQCRLKRLRQPNPDPELYFFFPFVEACLSLEQEFRVKRLRRHLLIHPTESETYAIIYFYNHLILAEQYRQQEAEFATHHTQLSRSCKPSLPDFP